MKKFFNALCISGAFMSCGVQGMNPERSVLLDGNQILPPVQPGQFEHCSRLQMEKNINTNPDVLNKLSLVDVYTALTSGVQLPKVWTIERVLTRVLSGALSPEEVSSALSKYSGFDALAFLSLAMIYKQFRDIPPKENQNLGSDEGDERIICNHISNAYLSNTATLQEMCNFFCSIVRRYGGVQAQNLESKYTTEKFGKGYTELPDSESRIIKDINNAIISIFQKGIEAIRSRGDEKAISNLLSCLSLEGKTDVIDGLNGEQKESLLKNLNDVLKELEHNSNGFCGIVFRNSTEVALDNIRNTLRLGHTTTMGNIPTIDNLLHTYFNLPSMQLTMSMISDIMLIGAQIRDNIYWAYNYKPEKVYEFVKRVGMGPFSGTGTVIQIKNMPENMKGRVALTASHMYLNEKCDAFHNVFYTHDFTEKKQCLQDYSSGSPFSYKTLAGSETIVESPVDRSNKDAPTDMRKNVTYNVTFDNQPVSKVYALMDGVNDFAIFILKDPVKTGDGSIPGVPVCNNGLPEYPKPRSFFTIGYGGWTSMDQIEFRRKKATVPFDLEGKCEGVLWTNSNDKSKRSVSLSGGDSGSAVFYHDGQEISIIGEAPSCLMPYIDNARYRWIQEVIQDAAQNP